MIVLGKATSIRY